eukprot:gene6434-13005_t
MLGNAKLAKTTAEADHNWEDEYTRLREQYLQLKQLCNEQEEHIRRLQAKSRKLENDFSHLERQKTGGVVKSQPRNREEEDLIATLYDQIKKLKSQNSNLAEKNKDIEDKFEKKKREVVVLKKQLLVRRNASGPQLGIKNDRPNTAPITEVTIVPGPLHHAKEAQLPSMSHPFQPQTTESNPSESNLLEIARNFKARLQATEQQLNLAREENAKLRSDMIGVIPRGTGHATIEMALDSQLKDTNWRLQQVQAQHDHLQAKSSSQEEALKQAEKQIEQQSQRIKDLRRVLEELRHEKELTDIKANRCKELEEEVSALRQENRELESKIHRLSEAPFISDAFNKQESKQRMEDLLRDRDELRGKYEHLQEALRTNYSALVSQKQEVAKLKEEKDAAENTIVELKSKYQELEAGSSVLNDKLRLFSGDEGVNLEELERALYVVKRRGEAMGKLDFLEDTEPDGLLTIPSLKRKLQDVQMLNLNLTKETERLENMLRLQSGINKDLHKELEALVHKREKDKNDLVQRADDFEEMARRRLEKIHSLEAQIREFVYGIASKKGKGVHFDAAGHITGLEDEGTADGSVMDSVSDMNALLGDLIEDKGGDISPDDNLLEVWVKGAVIKAGVLGPGVSTFAVIDFFDYESQTTSLATGYTPQWDFAATFKLTVDDFLLRYLATDVVTLELNTAGQGDFAMLARCTIPLSALLRSKPLIRLTNHPMLSNTSEQKQMTTRDIFKIIFKNEETLDEEMFLQCMLGLEVQILPNEYISLFEFIDFDEDRTVTIDQFLAILNLDDMAGIPAVLQEKLRMKARDLNGKGISPLKLFQQADQWGENGLVTRKEFKDILQRIGFQLVDEPDAITAYENETRNQFTGGGGGRIKFKADSDVDPLNDTVASGEEELYPTGGERSRNREVTENAKLQRNLFQEKLSEIQQKSRETSELAIHKAKAFAEGRSMSGGGGGGDSQRDVRIRTRQEAPDTGSAQQPPTSAVGINLLENQQTGTTGQQSQGQGQTDGAILMTPVKSNPYKGEDHKAGVSVQDTGSRSVDPFLLGKYASKLQSAFRRFKARKYGRHYTRPGANLSMDSMTGMTMLKSAPDIGVLSAEHAIRSALAALQGVQPQPDLLTGFQTVDRRGTGLVSRQQFAHVIRQFKSLDIAAEHLRTFMDYFDCSGNGKEIDYHAFVRMCRYRIPDHSPAVQRLQQMVLSPQSVLYLRSLDTTGTGYIKRADMLGALTDLGYGHLNQSHALGMISLFETKTDGLVNYANFAEFVRENQSSSLLDHISASFKQIIYNTGVNGFDEGHARKWHRKLDKDGKGAFTAQQLVNVLEENDLHGPENIMLALYASMTTEAANGVTFADFMKWIQSDPEANSVIYGNLSLAELQRKANLFLINSVSAMGDTSLEAIAQSYLIYDWRSSGRGVVSKAEFAVATRRTGFVFTSGELRSLSAEFAMNDGSENVAYKRFLAWATPDIDPNTRQTMADITSSSSAVPKRSSGTIIRFLEKALQRGVDLLAVFGRYDVHSAGRITSSEFCAAMSDLGLSSVTQNEALEFGDRFKAAAGDFVLYRKIFTELLRHIDEVGTAGDIDIIDVLRAYMQRAKVDIRRLRDIFEYYDRKQKGKVLEGDLGTIFEEAKIMLRRQEIQAIADRFSTGNGGNNHIQYPVLLSHLEMRLNEGPLVSRVTAVPEELASKVRALIENLIVKGIDYRSELDKFDENYSGSILQSDFREVFQDRMRAAFTAKDLEFLEKIYRDLDDPRKINHIKLLYDLHPTYSGVSPISAEFFEIVEILRQKIRRRCDFAIPGELKRPFRHFIRRKGEKGVSRDDLAMAVRDLGLRLAGDQEQGLFDIINLDGGRDFSYSDFVVFVRDPHHQDVIWKLRRFIARARISEKEMIIALNEMDSNDSGLLTLKQFSKAMKTCGVELSESDVSRLMS